MSVPEDNERFESYLKEFVPLAPSRTEGASRPRKRIAAFAGSMAAIAAGLVLVFHPHPAPVQSVDHLGRSDAPQLLTISRANALLARAQSFRSAVDVLAFQRSPTPLSNGTKSALTELSKEKTL